METIEQNLDNWLEEYSANKNLRNRLAGATKENPEGIIPDTAMILLSKREIDVLVKGLDIILQSNKESIMDCSYNFIEAEKDKNNKKQIENNTNLEPLDENFIISTILKQLKNPTIIKTIKELDLILYVLNTITKTLTLWVNLEKLNNTENIESTMVLTNKGVYANKDVLKNHIISGGNLIIQLK